MPNTQHVYISCVGEQDPVSEKTQVEGALLTCFLYLKEIENVQCHAAYFIPTSRRHSPERHTEERAEECRDLIKQIDDQIDVKLMPLEAQNPADLKQVYPEMRELVKSIVREAEQEAQGKRLTFHFNVSSATPQMKESFPFLVSTGQLAPHTTRLWQVFDPRGGFTELRRRVRPAPQMDLLTQERLLLLVERSAEQFLYREAADLLQAPLMMKQREFARSLYHILANHDQWQYKQARNQLRQLLKGGGEGQTLDNWLSETLKWLNELAQDIPPKDKLAIDRYYCACRRFIQGLYGDAITHFWTACELAMEAHGDALKAPRNPREGAWDFIRRLKLHLDSILKQRKIQLPNGSVKSILDAVDWLRTIRNKVEHGTQPVDMQLAKEAMQITEVMLEALGWGQQLSSYPLRPEQVETQLLSLTNDMRESLWS